MGGRDRDTRPREVERSGRHDGCRSSDHEGDVRPAAEVDGVGVGAAIDPEGLTGVGPHHRLVGGGAQSAENREAHEPGDTDAGARSVQRPVQGAAVGRRRGRALCELVAADAGGQVRAEGDGQPPGGTDDRESVGGLDTALKRGVEAVRAPLDVAHEERRLDDGRGADRVRRHHGLSVARELLRLRFERRALGARRTDDQAVQQGAALRPRCGTLGAERNQGLAPDLLLEPSRRGARVKQDEGEGGPQVGNRLREASVAERLAAICKLHDVARARRARAAGLDGRVLAAEGRDPVRVRHGRRGRGARHRLRDRNRRGEHQREGHEARGKRGTDHGQRPSWSSL